MKKLVLCVLTIFLAAMLNGQVITQAGARGGGLNSWILNSKIMTGNNDTVYRFSGGYTASINFGLYFNKRTYYSHKMKGVQLEVGYTGVSQRYKSQKQTALDYAFAWKLNYLDIGLFFQVMPSSDRGSYLTTGPMYSILLTSGNKGFTEDTLTGRNSFDYSLSNKVSSGNMQYVLEFGQYFNSAKNNNFAWHAGIRMSYGINDITRPTKKFVSPYNRNNIVYVGIVLGVDFKFRNYYN